MAMMRSRVLRLHVDVVVAGKVNGAGAFAPQDVVAVFERADHSPAALTLRFLQFRDMNLQAIAAIQHTCPLHLVSPRRGDALAHQLSVDLRNQWLQSLQHRQVLAHTHFF
jgi:hypothetical protein